MSPPPRGAAAPAPAAVDTADPAGPLVVVFNLASGHGDADLARQVIERSCRAAGRPLELMVVDPSGRLAEVARQAVERAVQLKGVVVAAGGDGTLSAVAQATLGSGCAIACAVSDGMPWLRPK